MKTRSLYVGAGLVLFALAALLVPNTRSLYEGSLFYVRGAVMPPTGIQPVRRDGRYASLYDLVRLRNAERFDYILAQLALPGLSVEKIRIPNSPLRDLFVRFNNSEPLTVYCAHYDKLYEDPNYQGASDNTAAVSTLLAGIEELARRGQSGSRAFLFTGEEERGLTGATAFVEYARANRIAIRDIVNFDSLGRGRLTIRPSADLPGFVFALPFYGEVVYDGTNLRTNRPYPLPNPRLSRALVQVQPDLLVLQRFTALSDSNVFQAQGIETVAISAEDMYYLERTWHNDTDRIELLDERNLDRAFELILSYPQ